MEWVRDAVVFAFVLAGQILLMFLIFAIGHIFSQARMAWRNTKIARLIRRTPISQVAHVTTG
jgi:hypothetical protein